MYYIKFNVEVDETYNKVHDLFKRTSVTMNFFNSLIPPNRIEYVIGPLTDKGVANWTDRLDGVGCKFQADVRKEQSPL